MIGEIFPKYQSGAKRTCLIIVGLRQLQAATACSVEGLLFQRRRSVILFRGLERLVKVTNRSIYIYIYIYMSAPTRDCYSVMICIIRKIHRLRKQLSRAIHGFLREVRIHRLPSAIHGSARSTDCAKQMHWGRKK